jgi:hypothetical protein
MRLHVYDVCSPNLQVLSNKILTEAFLQMLHEAMSGGFFATSGRHGAQIHR